jgi:hypothetical protein
MHHWNHAGSYRYRIYKRSIRRIEMSVELNEIEINGIKYVKKGTEQAQAVNTDGLEYVIVRTYSAGVHAGFLKSQGGKQVDLVNSRRLWYWSGAASLSQLAMEGVKNPDDCKFPCVVPKITLTESIEIIPCTQEAFDSIEGVKIWKE